MNLFERGLRGEKSNSSSMSNDVANVRSGFESLSAARWPADTKIAVMTTMPGNPANLNAVHPAVDGYPAIDKEPGFLSFMSETARTNFRKANSSLGDKRSVRIEGLSPSSDVNIAVVYQL